jgi:hypothetical protein
MSGCTCPCAVLRDAHPKRNKAVNPTSVESERFIISLSDESILKKLPYEKITEV